MSAGDRTPAEHVIYAASISDLEPGQITQKGTTWWARLPSGALVHLDGWTVEDAPEGISVTPSVKVEGAQAWHGHLTAGVWIEANP